MDKSDWLLLDEQEKTKQLSEWLAQVIELEKKAELEYQELLEKRKLERNVLNIIDWMKDYE
jgi:hypothetical protein